MLERKADFLHLPMSESDEETTTKLMRLRTEYITRNGRPPDEIRMSSDYVRHLVNIVNWDNAKRGLPPIGDAWGTSSVRFCGIPINPDDRVPFGQIELHPTYVHPLH